MTNTVQNEYYPDYVSSPGEMLLETLEAIGMPQSELAKRMNYPVKTINEIIQAKTAVTTEMALQLEQVLRVSTYFWLKREQRYQEYLTRLAADQRLSSWVAWLSEIPMEEMMRRGWMARCTDPSQQVFEALKFFGACSPDAWQAIFVECQMARYRQSATVQSHLGALSAWLRQGELESQEIDYVAPYNAEAFRDALSTTRALTTQPVSVFQKELVRLCANAGVAVVFVPELPNTGIWGATQWLASSEGKALIELTLGYQTDDHFWFTFFHEAGHILLHGEPQVFLEIDDKDREKEEYEADTFASYMLIPRHQWQQFIAQRSYHSKARIEEFAKEVGIAPGIVIGRLQHENLLPENERNDLKRHLEWA
ncbi:MAG TPA: HigA family addiction module antitoxin [Ktedonobacteraceae bacterium]|nr:HigA family addiction module antitoxin [Ktedonobacteraceae bacterium]